MNEDDRVRWKLEVLDEVQAALAESPALDGCLIYKGARVLNARLGEAGRQSLDIDSNLTEEFVRRFPERETQRAFLESEMARAFRRHFEKADPVRYSLVRVVAIPQPPAGHPRGWNAFDVGVSVLDNTRPNVLGLPVLHLDIAAPEALLRNSTAPLLIGHREVIAYTTERSAGEKLRAFLSSLPAYRKKMSRPGGAIRAKDVYDIARVLRKYPLDEREFWGTVGQEFVAACKSRFVDCDGLKSFCEAIGETEQAYRKDPTIPQDIPFGEAWKSLECVVKRLDENEMFPILFPLGD